MVRWNHRHGRAAAALSLLGMAVGLTVWTNGVREVHRSEAAINFAVLDPHSRHGDWPWWGGLHQDHAEDLATPPIFWTPSGNAGWTVAVPGKGRGGLCGWGENLFLPVVDAHRESVSLACLDRRTGARRWQTDVHVDGLAHETREGRSSVSETPACDGDRVFLATAVRGALWVTAVQTSGRILWQRDAGPYWSRGGYQSSPVLYKSLVIVAADNKGARLNRLSGTSYVAALHRHTGEIIWRVRRPDGDSFGTPVVATIAGRDQMVLAGRKQITSYNPATGDVLWTFQWPAERVANAIAFDGRHVYAMTRQPHPDLVCLRADGTGDVTRTHLVWRTSKVANEATSPIVADGKLYLAGDDGILHCLEAASGQVVWKRRLRGSLIATPLIAGQSLYCANDEGTVFVVRLGSRGDLIGEIKIEEGIQTAPVVIQNHLLLRSLNRLHCLAPPTETAPLANRPDASRRDL